MSDSLGLVRFSDGELRVAYYFGSTDMMVPLLFPIDEADEVWEGGMERLVETLSSVANDGGDEPSDAEDVLIWTAYGDGAWWQGRASRSEGRLISGVDPYGHAESLGGPIEVPRDVHSGTPVWVPDQFAV